MTQTESQKQSPPPQKKSSAAKWIAVIVVIIVVVGAVVVIASEHHTSTTTPTKTTTTTTTTTTTNTTSTTTTTTTSSTPLSVVPTTTGLQAQAGAPITFSPGLPSGAKFSKVVWNFGNGVTESLTTGNGQISYTYTTPGSYLVSVTVYNSTGSVSSNSSLMLITVTPSVNANTAAIYGPIAINMNSAGNTNQTIPAGGWINVSYAGIMATVPVNIGSPVPGNPDYTVAAFEWSVDGTPLNVPTTNATINVTFSTPGLHYITLTTISTYNGQNESGQYVMTVAVGNYAIQKVTPKVSINKNEIVDATWIPGGPRTFDPAIAYDTVSYETVYEVYQPLVFYSGEYTTVFNPVIAKYVPTLQNGGITPGPNGSENYTFYINTSLQFSNGDYVNAYDVYVSFARTLLFSNDPGDPGWIIAQALLPAPTMYGPFNTSFYWIHHAVTWNNATQSVTFHLLPTVPTWLPNTTAVYAGQSYGVLNQSYPVHNFGASDYFLQLISGPTAGDIMDYNWLVQHGGAPANNSASYTAFANTTSGPGVTGYWNNYITYNMMGTGPYELKLYEPSQEVIFYKNPYYHQTPGLLAPSQLVPEVVIEYLSEDTTAQQQLASGEAQFAEGAYPTYDTPQALSLIKQGIISSASVSELSTFAFYFNMDVNITGAQDYVKQTNIPAGFFANLDVRKAISYAFNYTYWIDVANTNSGITFAENLTGIIPRGMPEYLSNLSAQYPEVMNLTLAKYYWSISGYAGTGTYYFPVFNSEGNPTVDQMYSVLASNLATISNGQLQITDIDISFGQLVSFTSVGPGQNPMPIYFLGWIDDYPDASDFVAPFYEQYGIYTYPDGLWSGNPYINASQMANITQMWNDLNLAGETTNMTQVTNYYYQAQKIAVNMDFYFGIFQPLAVFYYSTAINPSSLALTFNPVVGSSFIVFYTIQYNP